MKSGMSQSLFIPIQQACGYISVVYLWVKLYYYLRFMGEIVLL